MKLKSKSMFTLFYIFFFTVVIIGSMGYTRKARLIPLVVAIPCLGFSIAQFVLDQRKGGKKGRSIEDDLFHGVMEKVHQEIIPGGEEKEKKRGTEKTRAFFKIVGWIGVFYVSTFLFGFLVTIPLFTILFMRTRKERWITSVACAAGLWVTIYLSFAVIAKISLYEGLVFRLLGGE